MRAITLLVVVPIALAACGTGGDQRQARATVERFYDAIRRHQGGAACAQLSAGTAAQLASQSGRSCASTITRLSYDGGAVVRAQVFVVNAKVDLRNDESAFLSREPSGWKLTAVGCKAADGKPRDRPYDCELEG